METMIRISACAARSACLGAGHSRYVAPTNAFDAKLFLHGLGTKESVTILLRGAAVIRVAGNCYVTFRRKSSQNCQMTCILFLDFDGVTHPDPCRKDEYFRQLPLIEDVLREHTHVNVVISSSWRYDHLLPELKALFSSDVRSRVIDVTPSVTRTNDEGWIPRDLLQHHREWECRKWIRKYRPLETRWLAIDDVAEWFTPGCAHLLTTQSEFGFLPEQVLVLERMIKERLDSL